MIKRFLFGLGLTLLSFLAMFSCKTADIRTTEVKTNFEQERGLEVLREMFDAHGLVKWDSIETYSFHLTDEFYGVLGTFSNPFPNNIADFDFDAIPQTFTSKVKFRDKKWKGKTWGIQSWRTFSSKDNSAFELNAKNDKTIEFWLPTYQYLIEVPLRIFEADVISYAGERRLDGITYDLVYATWNTPNPQKKIDQYILWIERESNLLKQMQYTVRDQYKWIHATLRYTKYEKVNDGLLFPSEIKINLLGPGEMKDLHKISIEGIKLNPASRDSFIVFPKLGVMGKSK